MLTKCFGHSHFDKFAVELMLLRKYVGTIGWWECVPTLSDCRFRETYILKVCHFQSKYANIYNYFFFEHLIRNYVMRFS